MPALLLEHMQQITTGDHRLRAGLDDDVAFAQRLFVRDAVADHVVDRGADRLRKAAVVQRSRDRAMRDDELVAYPVELFRGHARANVRRDEGRGRQPAGAAHSLEGLGAVQRHLTGFRFVPAIFDVHLIHHLGLVSREA